MIQNANDQLSHFNGSDFYYKYKSGMLLTDGVMELAETFSAYWWLDIICSYQPSLREHEFQTWHLIVYEDQTAYVEATDGDEKTLIQQKIEFTDFQAREATIWISGQTIMLPSEY